MSLNMTVVRSFARSYTEEELELLIRGVQEKIRENLGVLTSASTAGTSYTRQGAKTEEELLGLYEAALRLKRGEPVEDAADFCQHARPLFLNN